MTKSIGMLVAGALLTLGIAQATPLSEGVEYDTYSLPGPVAVYVIVIDREQPDLDLAMGFPYERRDYPARQTTSTIASNYDDPPDFDVIAAVNGSFFGSGIDLIGNLLTENNLVQLPNLAYNWPTFIYTDSGDCLIALNPGITDNQLRFVDGSSLGIDLVNVDRQSNTLVVYTPDWGPSTTTTAEGTEVIVQNVNYPFRPGKLMHGVVTGVRTGGNSTNNGIPSGGAVLSARDSKGATLASKTSIGDRIEFRISLSETLTSNAQMMIDGAGWILKDGSANTSEWDRYNSSFKGLNPRTMIAWNNEEIYLIAIDGRQAGYSVGMSFSDMADFCLNTLDATDAVNLDGGGSTAMWVNGSTVNSPSDGSERAVGNAVMLVRKRGTDFVELTDHFPNGARQLDWDDKFTYNGVSGFDPPAPTNGDGYVMTVMDPAGGYEIARIGDRQDGDITIAADIYCDYRPEEASNGFERVGLFARDPGQGGFEWDRYGGGYGYVMIYDSNDGRLRAARVDNGQLTDFLQLPITITESGWHRFRIDCRGSMIGFWLDGENIASVEDATYPNGYSGIGYREAFQNNDLMQGTRVDNVLFRARSVQAPVLSRWMIE